MRYLLLIAAVPPLLAEPPRSVEAFAQVGTLRFGGDEGSLGSALAFGSAVMVPLTKNWALDFSITTAHPEPYNDPPNYFDTRRTLVAPALIRRFGHSKAYGFAGVGFGVQWDSTHTRHPYFSGDPPRQDGIADFRGRDFGPMLLLGRGGAVFNPWSRLLVRGDLEVGFRYVIPNVTAKIGLGWRF